MTAANLKLEIEKALKKTTSPAILELIYTILRGDDVPAGKRISRKQYNKEIKHSVAQIKQGKTLTQAQMEKKFEKW